jgi:hypothetical protein
MPRPVEGGDALDRVRRDPEPEGLAESAEHDLDHENDVSEPRVAVEDVAPERRDATSARARGERVPTNPAEEDRRRFDLTLTRHLPSGALGSP